VIEDPTIKFDPAPILGTPITDADEAQLMESEYGLLIRKLLNECNGAQPGVAIAAALSAAFCVAVDVTPVEHRDAARRYLESCFRDALNGLEQAFNIKEENENGNHAGEPGQEPDQEVVN